METPSKLIKNSELRRNVNSHLQKNQFSSLSSDVEEYQEFTERLLNRAVEEAQERYKQNKTVPEIEDIKNQIVFEIALEDLNIFIKDASGSCLAIILAGVQYLSLSSFISESIDAEVNGLFGKKRFVSRQDELNRQEIYSSYTFVSNNSTSTQEVHSSSYSVKFTKTYTASVSITADIRVKTEIKIPFFAESIEVGISASGTTSESQSVETTVTAESQKIVVKPKSKIKVTYNFYSFDSINNYVLDLVVDESSRISYPDFTHDIYYGDPKCCEPCLLFKRVNTVSSPLNSFLREHPGILGKVHYRNDTVVRLEEKNGIFILRNFPATETIKSFGVEVFYGADEPI